MRRIFFWLLLIGFVWFLSHHLVELQQILHTLASGHWTWIGLAAVFAIGHFAAYTLLYKIAFDTIGLPFIYKELFTYVVAALAVNAATPSGGTANTLLFMDYAAQRDESPGKAGAGSLMAFLTGTSTLLLMLIGTFAYLGSLDRLERYEVVGYIILCLIILIVATIMLFGIRYPVQFERFFGWFRRIINHFALLNGRQELISQAWLEENSAAFTTAAESISHHQLAFTKMIGVAFLMHLTDLLALACLFQAYGQPVSLPPLLASYFVGQLFWVVSPTPQGIGIVEGVMAVVLASFGIGFAQATVISLAFRGLAFWLPLLIGFVLLRRLRTFRAKNLEL